MNAAIIHEKEALKYKKKQANNYQIVFYLHFFLIFSELKCGKFNFELIELKTDYGLIDIDELKKVIDCDCIVLVNSMPSYIACENMKKISEIAKHANAILVNDVSGSIGTENAKFGDIIFGSFGRWKP